MTKSISKEVSKYIPNFDGLSLADLKAMRDVLKENYDAAQRDTIIPEKKESQFVRGIIAINNQEIKSLRGKKIPLKIKLTTDYYKYPNDSEFQIITKLFEIKNDKDKETLIKMVSDIEFMLQRVLTSFMQNEVNFQILRLKLRHTERELNKKVFLDKTQKEYPIKKTVSGFERVMQIVKEKEIDLSVVNIVKTAKEIFETLNDGTLTIGSTRQYLMKLKNKM
jgi:hypothetical protein